MDCFANSVRIAGGFAFPLVLECCGGVALVLLWLAFLGMIGTGLIGLLLVGYSMLKKERTIFHSEISAAEQKGLQLRIFFAGPHDAIVLRAENEIAAQALRDQLLTGRK